MQSSSLDSASPAIGPAQELNTGQRRWLAEVYEANYLGVVRLCTRLLRNPEDAADAAQDVFVIAANSLDPEAPPAQARAWLLTVARNHCLDVLRRRTRLGKALVALGSEPDPSRDVEGAVADRHFVDSVFRQLTLKERQVLWQSAVESRPLADIAERLRLSYMAAAQVVHRARQHAAYVAARVAIVLGALGLGRQRSANGSLSASRVLAMAVLPLAAVVVIQTSSSPSPGTGPPLPGQSAIQPRGAGATTTAATGSAHDPAAPTSAGGGVLPATSIAPTATIPPEASSAVHSLTDQVRHAIGGLPGLPTAPLPSPSVPPVPGVGSVQTVIPVPSVIPLVPSVVPTPGG